MNKWNSLIFILWFWFSFHHSIFSIQVYITCIVHDLNALKVTENLSHMFLVSNWIVHSKFMDFNNSFEILVYYFLIGKMTGFGSYGEYITCMVMHLIRLRVSNEISYWIVMPLPSYYIGWTLNFERILSSVKISSGFNLWVWP